METTYTIDWIEKKVTSTGKEKADASLKTEGGQMLEKVTIWADYPGFAELMPGSKVSGTLSPAKDPRFGPTLYPPKPQKMASRTNLAIEKAQDTKRADIAHAQENKNESIKLASAQRDSVLIVTTFYEHINEDKVMTEAEKEALIKRKITEWRDWFLGHDFNQTLPF